MTAPTPTASWIVRCDCGQLNRVPLHLPPGKTVRCGACHVDISDLDETSNNGTSDDDEFLGDDDDA